ncbi:carbohydrate esterase family 16 protein [Auriculariales sp. MPI-PUGE-AT-0066]|nr:carbohydrate esterase family 16 protein [Auriculariales sp. MPI-PUGE-AT-0066]
MMQVVVASLYAIALARLALAAPPPKINFKNLVTFGDSFTDVIWAGDGGVPWPIYATQVYSNTTLYPFARAGGTCSNNLTYRPFPSVMESQVPLFAEQLHNGSVKLKPQETVYTLWIGTNDVGAAALLTGDGVPGVSVVDTTSCAVNWIKKIYALGGRNFIFQNMIPLETIPMYSPDAYYNRYWSFERNSTAWSVSMAELTKSGNAIAKLLLQDLAPQLPGAHIALFDSHALFTDMHANPSKYLNGTDPVNVTGSISSCVYEVNGSAGTAQCTTVPAGSAQDSYLWYDELHPSEQADRIVAREIIASIKGSTKWTRWFS